MPIGQIGQISQIRLISQISHNSPTARTRMPISEIRLIRGPLSVRQPQILSEKSVVLLKSASAPLTSNL